MQVRRWTSQKVEYENQVKMKTMKKNIWASWSFEKIVDE